MKSLEPNARNKMSGKNQNIGIFPKYQYLLDIVVRKMVKKGILSFYDSEDLKQSVFEKILTRSDKIIDQFQRRARFETYLSVVFLNTCREILRAKKYYKHYELECQSTLESHDLSSENALIIEDEIKKLKWILIQYNKKRAKIEICLKIKFRIPLRFKDFFEYDTAIQHKDYVKIIQELEAKNTISDQQKYSVIINIFNHSEQKNNTPDSLRKFIQTKIAEIINLLNGDPPASNYTEETVQTLYEKYLNIQETSI